MPTQSPDPKTGTEFSDLMWMMRELATTDDRGNPTINPVNPGMDKEPLVDAKTGKLMVTTSHPYAPMPPPGMVPASQYGAKNFPATAPGPVAPDQGLPAALAAAKARVNVTPQTPTTPARMGQTDQSVPPLTGPEKLIEVWPLYDGSGKPTAEGQKAKPATKTAATGEGGKDFVGTGLPKNATDVLVNASAADAKLAQKIMLTPTMLQATEQRRDRGESLTMSEKLAMILMAVTPAIIGYAMKGEKGAFIGGIEGLKGVQGYDKEIKQGRARAADAAQKNEALDRQLQNKIDVARVSSAGKGGGLNGKPSSPQRKVDRYGRVFDTWRDADGNMVVKPTMLPDGTQMMAPNETSIGADSLGNPVIKKQTFEPMPGTGAGPKARVNVTVTPKAAAPAKPGQPAPEGVATELPANVTPQAGQTLGDYMRQNGIASAIIPEDWNNISASMAMKGDVVYDGETLADAKTRMNLANEILKNERAIKLAKEKGRVAERLLNRRGELQRELEGLRQTGRKELIPLKTEAAKDVAKFKYSLGHGTDAQKRAKAARDYKELEANKKLDIDNKWKVNQDTYSKLSNMAAVSKLESNGAANYTIFNSFVKIGQQDSSVVRESDMALADEMMTLKTKVAGVMSRLSGDSKMSQQMAKEIYATTSKIKQAMDTNWMVTVNSYSKGAMDNGSSPQTFIPKDVMSVAKGAFEEKKASAHVFQSADEAKGARSSIPNGSVVGIRGPQGVAYYIKMPDNTLQTAYFMK